MTRNLARGVHLVGGLAAPTATEAMTIAATVLGRHLTRLTDGETGERSQWIWWQIDKLTALDGIVVGAPQINLDTGNPDYSVFPGLEVDESVTIPVGALGYAAAAAESYQEFGQLRTAGVIPAGVRFQVSLPTPYAVVVAWSSGESQRRLWEPFRTAMFGEVRAIQQTIPADDLAIQWDVAVEIGALEGVFSPIPELASFDRIVAELADCLDQVSSPAARGLHLCYGDYKHRHFVAPTDLGLSVRLANAVAARSPFDFVHMPVDRENGRVDSYFTPLSALQIDDAELALGVIDYDNDTDRINELVTAASNAGRTFSVATECGMARLGERGETVTLTDLLEQHARVAAPVR